MPQELTENQLEALDLLESIEGNYWDHLTFKDGEMLVDVDDKQARFQLEMAFRRPSEEEYEDDLEAYDLEEGMTVDRILYNRSIYGGVHHFGRHIEAERREMFYDESQADDIINESEWADIMLDECPHIDVYDGPEGLHYTFIFSPVKVN